MLSPSAGKMAKKPAPRSKKYWTEEEVHILERLWGTFSVKTIGKRIGRTDVAVVTKACLLKLGPPGRGTKRMTVLCRESGYHPHQIQYAAKNLGLELQYSADTRIQDRHLRQYRQYAITEEQEEEILAYLNKKPDGERLYCNAPGHRTKNGVWGVGNKPPCCDECKTTARPHRGKGLCGNCIQRRIRKNAKLKKWAEKVGLGE